jgi:hypothetical protein
VNPATRLAAVTLMDDASSGHDDDVARLTIEQQRTAGRGAASSFHAGDSSLTPTLITAARLMREPHGGLLLAVAERRCP